MELESLIRWTDNFEVEETRDAFVVVSPTVLRTYRQGREHRRGNIEGLFPCSVWSRGVQAEVFKWAAFQPTLGNEPKGIWPLVWQLVTCEHLILDEPLRSLLDHESHILHEAYLMLWEARFLFKEESDKTVAAAFTRTLLRWMSQPVLTMEDKARLESVGVKQSPTQLDRWELFLWLITLAQQNVLFDRCLLFFEGVDYGNASALAELAQLLSIAGRWTSSGPNPLGIFLELHTKVQPLYSKCPELADKVASSLRKQK